MARFDVHPHASGHVLDVQSDLLDALNTRVVVPLIPKVAGPDPARHLNPVFEIDGVDLVMMTQFMSAVPRRELGPPIANLDTRHDVITRALDMLLQGF